jgi:uncharacterized protein (UPF0218 family)
LNALILKEKVTNIILYTRREDLTLQVLELGVLKLRLRGAPGTISIDIWCTISRAASIRKEAVSPA